MKPMTAWSRIKVKKSRKTKTRLCPLRFIKQNSLGAIFWPLLKTNDWERFDDFFDEIDDCLIENQNEEIEKTKTRLCHVKIVTGTPTNFPTMQMRQWYTRTITVIRPLVMDVDFFDNGFIWNTDSFIIVNMNPKYFLAFIWTSLRIRICAILIGNWLKISSIRNYLEWAIHQFLLRRYQK